MHDDYFWANSSKIIHVVTFPDFLITEDLIPEGYQDPPVIHGCIMDFFFRKQVGTMYHKGRHVYHIAQAGSLPKRGQELWNGEIIHISFLVNFPPSSGGDGGEYLLAFQCSTSPAISKSVLQDQVDPFFDNGWGTVPVKGMLPDINVMFKQQILFPVHIDMKIRILLVEVMECNVLNILEWH